jgi:multicomponent Na+:H+ antiporter subunit C
MRLQVVHPDLATRNGSAMTWEFFIGHLNYWLFTVLMMTGLYVVVAKGNLVKKIVGLNIFQTSVFMLYISMGKVTGGTAPIFPTDMNIDPDVVYSNPLPHVLILTAIVVGIATTALGLALIVRIREEFGTIEEDDILEIERSLARVENEKYHAAMGGHS